MQVRRTSALMAVVALVAAMSSLVATTEAATSTAATAASIQKVIQMLEEMAAGGKKEMEEEQVEYAKFSQECSSSTAAFKKQISQESEKIEVLTSDIGALEVEVKELGKEISKLQVSETKFSADLKAQTEERAETKAAFLKEQTDYQESVSALERAIAVLQKENYDRTGDSAVLLQLQAEDSRLPAQAKSLIGSFLSMVRNDEADFLSAPPEANAYEFQSSGIVGMLKNLLDEFRAKLTECQKNEMNSEHAYNMVVTDLRDSIKNAKAETVQKSTVKSSKEEKSAMSKKSLSMSEDIKVKTEKLLADKVTDCDDESTFFADKQRVRQQELEAIAKAVEILSSDPMKTGAKYVDLNQMRSRTPVLAQLRSSSRAAATAEGIRSDIRQFLTGEGDRLHSQKIALLAQRIAADPFAKVKTMIDDMITRLLEEAKEDADHEGFCDTEMGKSQITRDTLTSEIEQLTAAVETSKATIMGLTQDIATLSKEVVEIQTSMKEATELRKEEKHANEVTIAESNSAQKAVGAATAVLKKFYDDAMVPTSFLQTASANRIPKMGSPEWDQLANPNFDSSTVVKKEKPPGATYGGQQDAAGGVLALLEVILSDFANVEAEATAEETTMVEKFQELMVESKRSISTKEKKIEMNTADKAAAESELQSQTADLKSTEDELIAANRYHDKLVPQCVDQGMTFEERTAAREEEIASLKQALKILDGQAATL
mmetsp:Transcript_13746/g.23944  ORF Transcript_13746/g.23944 Transcript_13746/m.23944 type:complete len:716 (+) Transcript_13746:43-2190(+)